MNLGHVIGVKCDKNLRGMFNSERTVYIAGKPYIVNCRNIVLDRQQEIFYVKVVRIQESDGKLIVGINANDGYESIVIDEKSLIKKSWTQKNSLVCLWSF